jgi:transposase
MTSKVTTLLRAPGVADPGRVDDAGTERRDPEVPEKAKRRTFTAKYKLEILAEYDAARRGRRGRCCAARACTPAISWSGARRVHASSAVNFRSHRDPQNLRCISCFALLETLTR